MHFEEWKLIHSKDTNPYLIINLKSLKMKRVLFLMLALVVGMTANAQVKASYKKSEAYKTPVLTSIEQLKGNEPAPTMTFAPSEVMTKVATHNSSRGFEEWETMVTLYDLQSNGALGNRIATWEDGTAAVVATWGDDGAGGYTNRGTGYNYFDGDAFGDLPEARIEGSVYSGWPSITPFREGEILASHGNSNVNLFKRDHKGEGEWESFHTFNNWTWPRIVTTHDGEYIHVIFAEQDASNTLINYVAYSRSTDGGQTWSEPADPPMVDVAGMYRNDIGADDYVMAANGDRVAILFAGAFYDLFYIYSEDNGETWTKQIIYEYPYDHSIDWNNYNYNHNTDTIWTVDNSASIAIDDNGTVHVAFALTRVSPSEDTQGSFNYWPFTDAIVYWNSNYTNEQGGHEILPFGEWSQDEQFMATMGNNGVNGISNTMNDERIYAMAEADGFNNLNLWAPDENQDGELNYDGDIWNNNNWGSYRTYGIATLPSISIDENNNMIIAYSVLSESRMGETPAGLEFYLRSCLVTARDSQGTWFYDGINLSNTYAHSRDEVYSVTACSKGRNGDFWIAYSADNEFGLVLDYSSGDDAQSTVTDNTIYAVRVNPTDLEGFDNVGEMVNPMTSARVFPNPTNGTLYVEVNASQSSDVVMSVFNIMGQKVAEKNVSINTGINTTSINTNELSSGVYFVTVKANGFEKTMKFVVK